MNRAPIYAAVEAMTLVFGLWQVPRSLSRSGYDFGYLVKLLTNHSLPEQEDDFFELLRLWFPAIYDIKYIMRACKVLKGGLQDVADDLGVRIYNCFLCRSNTT